MATLVNKIANNISIQCHNIIFKYVEEDLVMSMNIQLLSINSADANWTPAFVDISPTKVILRKLIEVTNLTICLDKRNDIGKIEMCQEPILYRCSMKLHLLRRYNAPTSHRASLLCLDMKSDAMHINISSVQFPMVMRLFNLMQALKDGSLEKRLQQGGQSQAAESTENVDQDGEGFISWAWNMLPTIFPEENQAEESDEIKEHITHFGYEIDQVQVTIKNQESTSTEAHTKRIKYAPLFQLQFDGCRGESIGVGRRWSTFQGSVQRIQVTPFDKCVKCGHTQSVDYFIKSRDTDNSTTDEQREQPSDIDLYHTNWDQYFVDRSADQLRAKEAALVIDICYCLEVPDENSTRLSEVGSDLEQSGLRERHRMRVFTQDLQFQLGPSVAHIVDTLREYADQYNYTPYLEVKPIPNLNQLHPPSSDDYEALMAEVPLRKYDLEMRSTTIEYKLTDHKERSDQKRLQGIALICNLQTTQIDYVTPFYPNRLVFTTCQLPQRPMKLFEACYQRINVNLSSIDMQLGEIKVGYIPHLEAYSREILYPHLWSDTNVLVKDLEVKMPNLEFGNIGGGVLRVLNDIQFGTGLARGVKWKTPTDGPVIQLRLQEIKWNQFETRNTKVQQFKLQNLSGAVGVNLFLQSRPYRDSLNVLDSLLQTPLDEEEVNPAIIMTNLGEITLLCNNQILQLINTVEIPNQGEGRRVEEKSLTRQSSAVEESTSKSTIIKTSINKDHRPKSRRSGSVALESVHSSSEKNATVIVTHPTKDETETVASVRDLFHRYKSKIISLDLKGPMVALDFTDGKCVQRIR